MESRRRFVPIRCHRWNLRRDWFRSLAGPDPVHQGQVLGLHQTVLRSNGPLTFQYCNPSCRRSSALNRIYQYQVLVPTLAPGYPLALYALTRICSARYIRRVESVFEIIAEPNRRAILSLLVSSQQSVGEIERQLHMPQPTVSKHLRVLRDAGFVESTIDAQRRLYRLKPEPLQEIDAWLAPFRRFWSAHVDALERHLDRMDQPKRTKKKIRRK